MMLVAPAEATDKMPDANVLEITDHNWSCFTGVKAEPPGYSLPQSTYDLTVVLYSDIICMLDEKASRLFKQWEKKQVQTKRN